VPDTSALATSPTHQVDFEPLGKRVNAAHGARLLDAARAAGLPLTADCGGAGSCGQCLVIVRGQPGALSPLSLTEEGELSIDQCAAGYRMACQAQVIQDVKVDVPLSSLISGQRLQVESAAAAAPDFRLAANERVIRAVAVQVAEPSLHDLRSDLERTLAAVRSQEAAVRSQEAAGGSETAVAGVPEQLSEMTASAAAVRELPEVLRQHGWRALALLRGAEVIGFLPPQARPVGLAVDLGTTKIAAYLVDLQTGETLAAEGRPNPQIGYGEDVISRLGFALRQVDGGAALAQAVHQALAELAQILCRQTGLPSGWIAEACIVGNSAMTHLLLELPVRQLALAPYVPASSLPLEVRAADLHLPFLADARVYLPGGVAGYIGSDLTAMAYASQIGQDERTVLGVDIGTNTEIVLALNGARRMVSLSCASGPAFEGAHIRAGMRAADGAIERVWVEGQGLRCQTIGQAAPVGICGSGIIDAVAALRSVGVLNARGRFQAGSPRVRNGREGLEYLLVDSSETGSGEEIVITQHDIDEIQYAKGAILAGITVLLEVSGITPADLDEVVLAGAFGSFLNLESATAIGLLPNLPLERYRPVGNAAGEGARQILVSRAARQHAAELARRIEYVELSVYPGFRRIFAKSMALD
jgi:uncharacterized 2Fe-2S/4Fe-4S cluster protein (DUF4445 family)